jgi:hypothetical protein
LGLRAVAPGDLSSRPRLLPDQRAHGHRHDGTHHALLGARPAAASWFGAPEVRPRRKDGQVGRNPNGIGQTEAMQRRPKRPHVAKFGIGQHTIIYSVDFLWSLV